MLVGRSRVRPIALRGCLLEHRAEREWKGGDPAARSRTATLLRLHPNHQSQFHCLLEAISVAMGFRGVTGGVYKARERIHRGRADPRLLAIPPSRGRVAALDPNWGVL